MTDPISLPVAFPTPDPVEPTDDGGRSPRRRPLTTIRAHVVLLHAASTLTTPTRGGSPDAA